MDICLNSIYSYNWFNNKNPFRYLNKEISEKILKSNPNLQSHHFYLPH